jgi:CubicO group peptidase (beta-lactamase class C family)
VRQLLAHQAGLYAFDEPVDGGVVSDLDRLAGVMARQRPAHPPGARQAYHAISLGFYEGELVRRIDPAHRTLGTVFSTEIADPLDLDAYIGLPDSIPDERLAPLEPPSLFNMLSGFSLPMMYRAFSPRSVMHRALVVNPGTSFYVTPERTMVRNLEVPSGGGVASARAIARAYGAFAAGGSELGLRRETLDALIAPAEPSANGFADDCLGGTPKFSLGFMRPSETFPFGGDACYGAPGAGGSMGFADPVARLGYGYVTNKMGVELSGDRRDRALREALYAVPAVREA